MKFSVPLFLCVRDKSDLEPERSSPKWNDAGLGIGRVMR